MPKTTAYSNGAGSRSWIVDGDWDDGAPVSLDTPQFDNGEGSISGALLPNVDMPTSGTYYVEILAGYYDEWEETNPVLSDYTGGSGGVTWDTLLINHADAFVEIDHNVGTITITAGTAYVEGSLTADVVIDGGLLYTEDATLIGDITDTAAGTVYWKGIVDGTISLTASELEIEGGMVFTADSITVATAAKIIAVDGEAGPREIVGPVTVSATFDCSVDDEDWTFNGDWTCTGATLAFNATGRVIVAGDLVNASDATTLTGSKQIRMTGTGKTIRWSDYDTAGRINLTIGAGASIATEVSVFARTLVVEATGSLDASSAQVDISHMSQVDFTDIAGTYTGDLKFSIYYSAHTINTRFVIGGKLTATTPDVDSTVIYNDVFSCGSLDIKSNVDNKGVTIALAGPSANCGDVTLGIATGTNRYGILDVSGVSGAVQINSLIDGVQDPGVGSSALVLGTKDVTADGSGNWDGTDIAVSASGGKNEVFAHGSTIDNMGDPGAVVTVVDGVDGGNNHANWVFVASSGGGMLKGLGVG